MELLMEFHHRNAATRQINSGVAILVAVVSTVVLAARPALAETNVIAFLNTALANKHIMLNRTRSVQQNKLVCTTSGDGHPHRDCQTITITVQQPYIDQARVVSQTAQVTEPLKFDTQNFETLPASALIQRVDYANCGQDNFNTSYTLTITGTKSTSVSKTHSLSVGVGMSSTGTFQASNGVFGGSSSMTVHLNVATSDSTTNSEGHSESEGRTWVTSINVAPGHAGYLKLLVLQQTIRVPFSAVVVVDGALEDNTSGYTQASQFLSEAERTVPFTGEVVSSGLSNSFTGNYAPDTPFNCADPKNAGQVVVTPTNQTIPVSALTKSFVGGFMTLQAATNKRQLAGATIGPADGVSYQVVSSSEVEVMDPACGFNDIGAPNGAIHLSETRHYTNYANGVLVAEWDETSDTFLRCSA